MENSQIDIAVALSRSKMEDSRAGSDYVVIGGLRCRRKHPAASPVAQEPKRLKSMPDPKRRIPRFQSCHPQGPVHIPAFPASVKMLCEEIVQAETADFVACMKDAPRLVATAIHLRDMCLSRWKIALDRLISEEEQAEAKQKERQMREDSERRIKREKLENLYQMNRQSPAVLKHQTTLEFLQSVAQHCKIYLGKLTMMVPSLRVEQVKAYLPVYECLDLRRLRQACEEQKRQTTSKIGKLFRFTQTLNLHQAAEHSAREAEDYRQFRLLWGIYQASPQRLIQRFLSTSNSLNYV